MSKHADDMFKLLKLDDGVENLLANPAVQKWVSFVERTNKLKPENKVSILETLMKNYDDAAVAKIIQQASKTRSTEGLSRSLKRELLLSWSSANKSPATLLKALKLDTEAKSLVTSPAVELLLSYVNVWNRNNPTKKTTLMNTIMTSTKYDEAMVAKAFQTAKQVKATKKMALQLQGFQFDRWMEIGYKPRKIIGVVFSTKYTEQEALIAKLYKAYYKNQKKVFKELEKLENAP